MRVGTIVWTVVGLIGLSGAVLWRMSIKAAADAELAKGQAARKGSAPRVVLGKATTQDIEQSIDAVGSLESPFVVKLSPKVAGRIDYLRVREGDTVAAGQVLAKIDPSDLKGQVLEQEAAVAEAQSRLAQARLGAGATETSVTATITQQRASVTSAQADYLQAQESYRGQLTSAQATVTDAQAKLRSAQSDIDSAQSDLNAAKANRENAQSKYDRTKNLFEQGFIASQDLEDAQTALKVQQGALEVAQSKVNSAKSAFQSAQAQLDSAKAQAKVVAEKGKSDIAASRAKLKQAQASLTVAHANRSQSPAYQENISALASSVQVAQAQLNQAQSKVSDTELKSSIEGVVTARQGDEGSLASAGQPLLTVQYLKWLYVTASIPIEQGSQVRLGSQAQISIDALPGQPLNASVIQVNPSADAQSRQFTIRLRLDNAQGQLRPGMFAHVHIVTGTVRNATVVPRDAVTTNADGSTLITVDKDMVAHVTPVVIGASATDIVQVRDGVSPGDKVVVLSYSQVKDGAKVREGDSGKGKGKGGSASKGGKP